MNNCAIGWVVYKELIMQVKFQRKASKHFYATKNESSKKQQMKFQSDLFLYYSITKFAVKHQHIKL